MGKICTDYNQCDDYTMHGNNIDCYMQKALPHPPEGPNRARTCTSCHIAICSCPLSSSRSITRYLCFTCCHALTRTITCFTKPYANVGLVKRTFPSTHKRPSQASIFILTLGSGCELGKDGIKWDRDSITSNWLINISSSFTWRTIKLKNNINFARNRSEGDDW